MKVGSLFSGIEGFGLGCERAGMDPLWQVEADSACRSVLARHWPTVDRYDDVRSVHGTDHCPNGGGCPGCLVRVDVLTGGFPCQDLSVAGRRAGLGGARSGLWWEMWRLMAELAPTWVLIENVPGLLSAVCPDPDTGERIPGGACPGGCMSAHGGAMGTLLGAMAGLGYGHAYRVLDTRFFGLAQRRSRVLVVCRAGGDGASAAQVLLEPEGLSGGPEAGGAAGQDVAGTLGGGAAGRGWCDDTDRTTFVPIVSGTLTGTHRHLPGGRIAHDHLVAYGLSTQGEGGSGTWSEELAQAVTGSHGDGMVAMALLAGNGTFDAESETLVPCGVQSNMRREVRLADVAVARAASSSATQLNGALTPYGVRRLTPVERERLQGFPDDWTRWGHDGTEMSVSARERMTGNAVPVPMVEWVARRILTVAA